MRAAIVLLITALLASAPAWAAPDNALPSLGSDPEPSTGTGGEESAAPQPEVTIRRQGDAAIEEYRINGRLYMIRVIPRAGAPYYLVDADGDGFLETRQNELDPRILVPNWTILQW